MTHVASRSRRAMTLVEVLAVVVILGLMAGTLMVGFSSSVGKAKHDVATTSIGVIAGQLEKYRLEHGQWPTNDEGLGALSDGKATAAATYYLNRGQLLDPWKQRFMYVTPGPNGQPYEITSYGADGQPGGDGENGDITSANLRGLDE